jgi:hypothetical protein
LRYSTKSLALSRRLCLIITPVKPQLQPTFCRHHKGVVGAGRPPSLLAWTRCQTYSIHAQVVLVMPTSALLRYTLGCAISPTWPEQTWLNYPHELCRFHIHFFDWFSDLSMPIYLLTSIGRYDIPGRQASCRAPVSPPNLPAFVPGQTPFSPLAPFKLHAKQCDFCNAANLASSALAGTSLATIQSLPMRYFHTHGERILRRSLSKT